jgi:hypothetical protein
MLGTRAISFVMPAKAGIQGVYTGHAATGPPLFRGCQEIEHWLDRRGASFETTASRPPQDEVFS